MSAVAKTNSVNPSALAIVEPGSFSLAPLRDDDAEQRFHAAIRHMPDALGLMIRDRGHGRLSRSTIKQAAVVAAVVAITWTALFGVTRLAF